MVPSAAFHRPIRLLRACLLLARADLDHLNEDLRSHLKDWLNHLKDDVGYEGWRFDFVKGYGPQFVKEYVLDTVGPDTFNVGEYWVDLRCAPVSQALMTRRQCAGWRKVLSSTFKAL